jgi:hypothetical protein
MAGCDVHPFDQAVDTCGGCDSSFCSGCLVYPFGQRRAPLCVRCALEAAGVRRRSERRGGLLFRRA